MKLRRWVSLEELKTLVNTGEVKPKEKYCYFFDLQECYCNNVKEQLSYISGVVGEYKTKNGTYFISLDINLPKRNLIDKFMRWADPYGSFWDTIYVMEKRNKTGYTLANVEKAKVYKGNIKKKVGTPQEILEYVESL